MQVFSAKEDAEPILIGRCDDARLVAFDSVKYNHHDRVTPAPPQQLQLVNWVPIYPADNKDPVVRYLTVAPGSKELQQIMNVLGMLVERNGGAVVADINDLMQARPVTVLQQRDPWGIVLTTEGP